MWERVSTGVCSGDDGYRSNLPRKLTSVAWLFNDNEQTHEGKLSLAKGLQNMHLFCRDFDAKRINCISKRRGVELIKPN